MNLLKEPCERSHHRFHHRGRLKQLLKQMRLNLVRLSWEDADAFHHVATKHQSALLHRMIRTLNVGERHHLLSELLDPFRQRGHTERHGALTQLPVRSVNQRNLSLTLAGVFLERDRFTGWGGTGRVTRSLIHRLHHVIGPLLRTSFLLLCSLQRCTKISDLCF